MTPRTVGIIDGTLFLGAWSIAAMSMASEWWDALPIILFLLVPVAALVSWRGASLSSRFFKGVQSPTLREFSVDGAKWGLFASMLFVVWSVSSQVFAAGNPLEGADLLSKDVGFYLLYISLPICAVGALLGAAHGVAYFYINRWLLAANTVL